MPEEDDEPASPPRPSAASRARAAAASTLSPTTQAAVTMASLLGGGGLPAVRPAVVGRPTKREEDDDPDATIEGLTTRPTRRAPSRPGGRPGVALVLRNRGNRRDWWAAAASWQLRVKRVCAGVALVLSSCAPPGVVASGTFSVLLVAQGASKKTKLQFTILLVLPRASHNHSPAPPPQRPRLCTCRQPL